MTKTCYSIAIDGPSGAGKSSVAKILAERLGYLYVDTGAIYRTVGLHAFRNGVASTDEAGVVSLLGGLEIGFAYGEDGLQHMYLCGEDVTEAIRRHEISKYASDVSAMPDVRAFLLQRQRDAAKTDNVIMDGRDIGTVVLPEADVKIFLTAKAEERARRRYLELTAKGEKTDFETVLSDINQRDYNDSHRAAAPLRQAEDAVLVDSTGYSLEEVADMLLAIIRERVGP